jgi:hypothetical protein
MDQAQEDVLRSDMIVVPAPGLFLCLDYNQPCPVSEPLEHAPPPFTLRLCPLKTNQPGSLVRMTSCWVALVIAT